MKDIIPSFLPTFLLMAVWFAPIYLVYRVAYSAKKNTSYVLLGGLLLGWFGAAVVALICPRLSDEEFEKLHAKSKKARAQKSNEPMDTTNLILTAVGICSLILVVGMLVLWRLVG